MNIEIYLQKLNQLLTNKVPVVSVTLVDALGSTPQDQGSKMLVTQEGLYYGTVGGGQIENKAILEAQELLSKNSPSQKNLFRNWNLIRDVGMTCGGSVKLFFESFNINLWEVVVFGAGHVAGTLIPFLLNLDCVVTCFDPREKWLGKLPKSSKLNIIQTENLVENVDSLSPRSFVLLMTQGHKTDRPILQKLLEKGDWPYLGVIGSKGKATTLRKEMQEHGLSKELCQKFYCPIGLPIGSNHPYEISISILAQLIQIRDEFYFS